jgi:CBS domain-containing protein
MNSVRVKELMVPIDSYATVPPEATLRDAILALDRAQQALGPSQHKHRAILVLDSEGEFLGKIALSDIISALAPDYSDVAEQKGLSVTGLSLESIQSMLDANPVWHDPMQFLCDRSPHLTAREIAQSAADHERIDEEATMGEAVHRLASFSCASLLVTREDRIVGVLRMSDVFARIVDDIKDCCG